MATETADKNNQKSKWGVKEVFKEVFLTAALGACAALTFSVGTAIIPTAKIGETAGLASAAVLLRQTFEKRLADKKPVP